MKGLAIVDPGHLKTNALTSPIVIEKLIVNGQSFDPRGPIEVKPGEGKLEISFTSPSMTNSETIRFRYKLDGFETSWTDAGTRRTAYYTNIQPGLYRFTVTSRNSDGVWNNTGATVSLTLRPHYYQTHTFMVLCAALLLALSLGVYALRMRQLKANEKRLVQVVGERTKALEEQVRAKEQAHAELAQAQQSLMDLSRRSGMAEVATGVLHNVGNVLNSVNVGASVIGNKLRESRVEQLCSAVNMLQENAHDLSGFVQANPKGQRLLPYLVKLAQHLQGERNQVLGELDGLTGHIDHIKEIVATQQDYAKASALAETVGLDKLISQALAMVEASLSRHHVDVVVHIDDTFEITVIKHKVVEILVNLIRNAKQAVIEQDGPLRQVCVSVKRQAQDRVRIEIHDTGVGLAPENLTRIFAHGFTTKQNGHGFGLHSGALSAQQMGGSLRAESEGPGRGATFILELPATQPIVEPEMSTV
jgi:C4-dicarboxylate-specific signal transduction histidine kinase